LNWKTLAAEKHCPVYKLFFF